MQTGLKYEVALPSGLRRWFKAPGSSLTAAKFNILLCR